MPSLKRCIIHNSLVEVCFRTEEGLPFVATAYMKLIMRSIMASAQTLYPTTVCHFVLMANHMHLLLVVKNPEDFVSFIGYIKRESAHAVNHLLGRQKHTVWCERYDDPKILDPDKAVQRIVYLYTNPQKANLVETIDEYPNLSTWQAFLSGGEELTVGRIARSSIPELYSANLTPKQQRQLVAALEDSAGEEQTLIIEPDAWMQCFSELRNANPEEVNEKILAAIRQEEELLQKHRAQNGLPVLGATALQHANMRKVYTPQKRGKRMICLSSVIEYRKRFIEFYKDYTGYKTRNEREAMQPRTRTATRIHSHHDWLSAIPPGLFLPGGRLFANLCPTFVPVIGR